MRRSLEPRVPSQGEILFSAPELGSLDRPHVESGVARASILNLSQSGLCARGRLPLHATDRSRVEVALALSDGAPPITISARVAWVTSSGGDEDATRTFGLCFVDPSGPDRVRLGVVVDSESERAAERSGRVTASRVVRLRLADGPSLRAQAESIDERGVLLGAELPWLKLGAKVEAELDGRAADGRIEWIGMDVAASGAAHLRLRVAWKQATPGTSERRDSTLPYFSTAAMRDSTSDEEPAPITGDPAEALRELAAPKLMDPAAQRSAMELVRRGTRRRRRLAMLRLSVALLALSSLYLFARSLRAPRPVAAPVVMPAEDAPAEPTAAAAGTTPTTPAAADAQAATAITTPLATAATAPATTTEAPPIKAKPSRASSHKHHPPR